MCIYILTLILSENNNTALGNTKSLQQQPTDFVPALKSCLSFYNIDPRAIVSKNNDKTSAIYKRLNYQWNSYGGIKYPMAYFVVRQPSDVQAVIICCRKLNIHVVPKSGGHSFEKYSYGDSNSLVIDLQELNQVTIVEPGTGTTIKNPIANVGSGILLGPLIWKLYSTGGYAIPSGLCPSVGVSLALGGGVGSLPRYYGVTTDMIQEIDLVTANGTLLTINTKSDPELLWALKGAGIGASFGIVTRFQFKLLKAPEFVLMYSVIYQPGDFPYIFDTWQQIFHQRDLTSKLNSMIKVSPFGINLDFTIAVENLSHVNESLVLLEDILEKFADIIAIEIVQVTKLLTYSEYLLMTAFPSKEYYNINTAAELATKITRLSSTIDYFKTKSIYVSKFVKDPSELAELSLLIADMPQNASLVYEAYGGAINSIPIQNTAFIHRTNIYHVTIGYAGYNNHQQGIHWMNKFFEETKMLLNHTESYQNYADHDLQNSFVRFYGKNGLKKLVGIKRRMDPDNYFKSPESIPLNI